MLFSVPVPVNKDPDLSFIKEFNTKVFSVRDVKEEELVISGLRLFRTEFNDESPFGE